MKRTNRRGFTLIELLVVVAIIALLIAILLPALGKAKTLALRTRCGTALKGWGEAVATYQAEFGGTFVARITSGLGAQWDQDPGAYGISTASPNQPGVYSNEGGSALSKKLRFCPADPQTTLGQSTDAYYGGHPLPSYKFVYYTTTAATPINTGVGIPMYWKISTFKDQANKLLMCDSSAAVNYGYFVTYVNSATGGDSGSGPKMLNGIATKSPEPSTAFSAQNEIQNRHGGYGSVLFLDSHVESLPWSTFLNNLPLTVNDGEPMKTWTRLSQ